MGPEWPTMLGLCSPKWGSGKVNATYATPNYFSVTMQKSLRWGLRRPTLPPFHYSSITMQSIAIKVILNYLYLKGASHEGASRHESFENVRPFPFGVLAGWVVLSILIYAFVCFELQLLRVFFLQPPQLALYQRRLENWKSLPVGQPVWVCVKFISWRVSEWRMKRG